MKTVFIYGLIDPRTGEIRYIGKSNNIFTRIAQHISYANREINHRANWIRALLNIEMKPEIVILQEVSESEWQTAERAWIRYGWEMGWPLTNSTDGGEGLNNPSQSAIDKIRNANLGRKHSEETKIKISESGKGKHSSPKKSTKPYNVNRENRSQRLKGKRYAAKHSDQEILEIRELYDSGSAGVKALSELYKIPYHTVYDIVSRKSYSYLP